MDYTQISLKSLHPALGAEVSGVDMSRPLDDVTRAEILDAWAEHLVLVFPDQDITDAEHVAFSRALGDLEIFPQSNNRSAATPEIFRISNVDEGGNLLPADSFEVKYTNLVELWHTDSSYRAVPAKGALLHAIEIPEQGADTQFVNLAAAYDALPDARKRAIADLRAVHAFEQARDQADGLPPMDEAERKSVPPVIHPLVHDDPATGRKSLYISPCYVRRIDGLSAQAGRALIEELCDWAIRPAFMYQHKWRPHDVLMWDNRCTMHARTGFDFVNKRRVMHRTTLAGDGPIA